MKIDTPGIYNDFDVEAYHADPCPAPSLSQSIAKVLLDQSPLHARAAHPRLAPPAEVEEEPEKYVKARVIGDAAHAILIGRGKKLAAAPFDNWKTKDSQKFKEEAVADGLTPILDKHLDLARGVANSARAQIAAVADAENDNDLRAAFTDGHGEVVIVSHEGPIWRRSLIDWMATPRLLFDYKTTATSASPLTIPDKMAKDGWPIQAAMQERILDALDPAGAGRRRFFFIAHEQYEPFALTVHELSRAAMTMGRKMLDHAEIMWAEAVASGQWPGYAPRINHPEYPGWKEARWLEREIAAADRPKPKRAPFNPETRWAG